MSTMVETVGRELEEHGCREYVNCTVDGEERCSFKDMPLYALPHRVSAVVHASD